MYYHFLNLVQQLERNILIQDLKKIGKYLLKEKEIFNQTCLKYLSNINPKISIIDNSSLK